VEGTVSLIPANMRYSPAFPGMIQHKVLAVKSTFDVPILIKQVHCSDPRIISNIVNKVIMPKNKTELGMLTFDPGQSS